MDSGIKRHEPLYLKYRPQSLSALVGQEAVMRTLTNAINHDRISHAYLFTGPRGTGKTSTARILAKSLNCLKGDGPALEPCQSCTCCLEITQGTSPAVLEIDAASNNSVDDARTLIERAPLKAVGGRFKVYIIDECHMLTKEAFNALLKTIEQPPADVIFILATTEEHKVLPTIVSRCQRLLFRLINQESLIAHLGVVAEKENINISADSLKLIARRSGGGLRDALSTLDQASLLASSEHQATVDDLLRLLGALNEDVLLELSRSISQRDGRKLIDSVNRLLSDGREPPMIVQELARHFLHMTRVSYLLEEKNAEELAKDIVPGSASYVKGLLEQAADFERSELSAIIETLDRLESTCRRTSQPMMHLEIGLLGVCHRHEMMLVKELSARVAKLEQMLANGVPAAAAAARGPAPSVSSGSAAASARPSAAPSQVVAGGAPSSLANEGAALLASSGGAAPAGGWQQSGPTSLAGGGQQSSSGPIPLAGGGQQSSSGPIPLAGSGQQSSSGPIPLTGSGGEPSSGPIPLNSIPVHHAAGPEDQMAAGIASGDDQEMAISLVQSEEVSDHYSSSLPPASSDMDAQWAEILAEVHRRSLPAYSLISMHAFAMEISNNEICVGVHKENFQKMIEQKADHLKAACQAVLGRSMTVRVRVGAGKPQTKVATAAVKPSLKSAIRDQSLLHGDTSSPVATAEEPPSQQNAGKPSVPLPAESSPSRPSDEEPADGTMVKEAYKLFEGPGSRRIQ